MFETAIDGVRQQKDSRTEAVAAAMLANSKGQFAVAFEVENDKRRLIWPKEAESRNGLTLLEVLLAIFVLSVGLLGILALLAVGAKQAHAVDQQRCATSLADAATKRLLVRTWMDANKWCTADGTPVATDPAHPMLIDPILCATSLFNASYGTCPAGSSGIQRGTLLNQFGQQLGYNTSDPSHPYLDFAHRLFADESIRFTPGDANSRPEALKIIPDPSEEQYYWYANEAGRTWMFTVSPTVPVSGTMADQTAWNVQIAVLAGRNLTADEASSGTLSFIDPIAGEADLTISGNIEWSMEKGGYILITDGTVCAWYEALLADTHDTVPVTQVRLSLHGPTWAGQTAATAILIPDVIFVSEQRQLPVTP